ncbi:hypothetical protein VTJ83DRAFT_243 [Remersonia thermophila]|uniref:Uncharacterized protein n=1 Tax=Remersonia thermophila TaxID=72144 RepID=A0ABR4DM80_9PEZI
MNRFALTRLLGPELARPLSKAACPTTAAIPQWARLFSHTRAARNIPPTFTQTPLQQQTTASDANGSAMDRIRNVFQAGANPAAAATDSLTDSLGMNDDDLGPEPYHFHIYSHKHNTHITVTKPNRDALISLSCGNLGFRKAQRGTYDAAYQLGAYVIDKMHQKGLVKQIHKLEIVLRGFGNGREAVVKVLMGNEGKLLRPKIVRVSDATRLKFGGTRSPKKRRLG